MKALIPIVRPKKILLIEDDSTYGEALNDRARQFGVQLDCVSSSGLGKAMATLDGYDCVMLNYDLESTFTGLEMAEFLGKNLPHKTLVMVAQTITPWQKHPRAISSIRAVVSKWDGIDTLLAKTLTVTPDRRG